MPKSPTEKVWLFGGALLGLFMVIIGYFMVIGPQRDETADVDGQIEAAQTQVDVLQTRINQLRVQSKEMPRFEADLAAAHKALPSTSDVPDFLRTMQSLGNSTGTNVTTLTVGSPVAAVTGALGANGASATPAPKPKNGAAAPQLAQLYALPITATVNGSPTGLNSFLQQLQAVQPRAVIITALTEGAGQIDGTGAVGKGTTLQLTMSAFVAPTVVMPAAATDAAGK